MSSEGRITFTKNNLDTILKELAKEYRHLGGKSMPAELVLIGGASVLINYGFRDMTTDIDAVIQAASTMEDAINHVGDRLGLPNGWLNEDFRRTDSYTPKLAQYSIYYKKFYGVMTVRTISSEYLIAMKLKAGRQYKNDLSDIVGILAEQQKAGCPITEEMIHKAVTELYDDWKNIPESARVFIDDVIRNGDYESIREEVVSEEKSTKDILLNFEGKYPDVANKDNVESIIAMLKCKAEKSDEEA